jgi:hypothetical protein
VKNLNPVVHCDSDAMTRGVVASNRVMTLWHTVIGKKVVMAITGVVLVGFVIVQIFAANYVSSTRKVVFSATSHLQMRLLSRAFR